MITAQAVQELFVNSEQPLLSLYLNVNPGVDENQANTPAWQIWLKNTLNEIESGLSTEHKAAWTTIRGKVDDYFRHYRPQSRTLVLFAGVDTFHEFALPLPTENQGGFGAPLIAPLLWLLDEYERYLIVLADQDQAIFYLAYLGHAGLQDRMEIDIADYDWGEKSINPATSYGKMITHGSNREAFKDMIEEHRARYYRDVAAHVEALSTEHDTNRIIFGGSEEAAHAVRRYLPDRMAKQVIDILPIPLKAAPHQVQERVMPAALEYERQYEADLLDEVINLAKSGGRGALGRADVESALEQQRVEMIIVPYPYPEEAWMTELPERILASSTAIEHVHGAAAERLQAEGGIAARLYYTV